MSSSPPAQRTNIARFGMGCRMYAVVSDPENVLANIVRFEDEIKQSHALQKRLAYARAWYAYQDEKAAWHFGAWKFVGYEGMTAARYVDGAEERDGCRTEGRLQE